MPNRLSVCPRAGERSSIVRNAASQHRLLASAGVGGRSRQAEATDDHWRSAKTSDDDVGRVAVDEHPVDADNAGVHGRDEFHATSEAPFREERLRDTVEFAVRLSAAISDEVAHERSLDGRWSWSQPERIAGIPVDGEWTVEQFTRVAAVTGRSSACDDFHDDASTEGRF